jgi:hypothetical protein
VHSDARYQRSRLRPDRNQKPSYPNPVLVVRKPEQILAVKDAHGFLEHLPAGSKQANRHLLANICEIFLVAEKGSAEYPFMVGCRLVATTVMADYARPY